jgi:hypothetical protein
VTKEKGTRNEERGMRNEKRGRTNEELETRNEESGMRNREPGSRKQEEGRRKEEGKSPIQREASQERDFDVNDANQIFHQCKFPCLESDALLVIRTYVFHCVHARGNSGYESMKKDNRKEGVVVLSLVLILMRGCLIWNNPKIHGFWRTMKCPIPLQDC